MKKVKLFESKKSLSNLTTTILVIVIGLISMGVAWTLVVEPVIERGVTEAEIMQKCNDIGLTIEGIDIENNEIFIFRDRGARII